jgi:hypothetical protein
MVVKPSVRGALIQRNQFYINPGGIPVPISVTHGRSDTGKHRHGHTLKHWKLHASWFDGVGHAPFENRVSILSTNFQDTPLQGLQALASMSALVH